MKLFFSSTKNEKLFNSSKELQKKFGEEQSNKIKIRLKTLESAANLAEVSTNKPERCHQLKGNRKGQFAVDLNHPFQLIFKPSEPIPTTEDGGIDLRQVTNIIILGVEDYHGD